MYPRGLWTVWQKWSSLSLSGVGKWRFFLCFLKKNISGWKRHFSFVVNRSNDAFSCPIQKRQFDWERESVWLTVQKLGSKEAFLKALLNNKNLHRSHPAIVYWKSLAGTEIVSDWKQNDSMGAVSLKEWALTRSFGWTSKLIKREKKVGTEGVSSVYTDALESLKSRRRLWREKSAIIKIAEVGDDLKRTASK